MKILNMKSMKTISRNLFIIGMEVGLNALLARLHKEWEEKISADEETKQVGQKSRIQFD